MENGMYKFGVISSGIITIGLGLVSNHAFDSLEEAHANTAACLSTEYECAEKPSIEDGYKLALQLGAIGTAQSLTATLLFIAAARNKK